MNDKHYNDGEGTLYSPKNCPQQHAPLPPWRSPEKRGHFLETSVDILENGPRTQAHELAIASHAPPPPPRTWTPAAHGLDPVNRPVDAAIVALAAELPRSAGYRAFQRVQAHSPLPLRLVDAVLDMLQITYDAQLQLDLSDLLVDMGHEAVQPIVNALQGCSQAERASWEARACRALRLLVDRHALRLTHAQRCRALAFATERLANGPREQYDGGVTVHCTMVLAALQSCNLRAGPHVQHCVTEVSVVENLLQSAAEGDVLAVVAIGEQLGRLKDAKKDSVRQKERKKLERALFTAAKGDNPQTRQEAKTQLERLRLVPCAATQRVLGPRVYYDGTKEGAYWEISSVPVSGPSAMIDVYLDDVLKNRPRFTGIDPLKFTGNCRKCKTIMHLLWFTDSGGSAFQGFNTELKCYCAACKLEYKVRAWDQE